MGLEAASRSASPPCDLMCREWDPNRHAGTPDPAHPPGNAEPQLGTDRAKLGLGAPSDSHGTARATSATENAESLLSMN